MTAHLRQLPIPLHPFAPAGLLVIAVILFAPGALVAQEAEPLRALIDRELPPPFSAAWPLASDAEFLRRVSIDLTGMPPSADDARSFLNSTDPARREQLVDRLLGTPQRDRQLASSLDVMLMERRGNSHVPQDEWMSWLVTSVRENKPWNVLVREMLTADGESPGQRAPARFILDRNTEPNAVARDIGRVFFGRDMQCAQCHDSPLVADFLQQDYQGLLAITTTIVPVVKKIAEKDVTVLAERSGSDLSFESVFIKGTAHRTGARVMGESLLTEPFLLPGEEYTIAPADGVRSVPKFSRRSLLAEQMTNGSNRWFNENIVNRLWAMMLGRGLVHPLDVLHPDNPAVSPSLLKQLGERFAESNFDIRNFQREVALSNVYQRPFDLPGEQLAVSHATESGIAVADSETSRLTTTATWEKAYSAFQLAEAAMIPVAAELDTARTQYSEARKKVDEAARAITDANSALELRRGKVAALDAAAAAVAKACESLAGDSAIQELMTSLTARTAAVTAEIPALEAAVLEKTTALTAPTDALTPVRATAEAAAQKLAPLLEVVRTTDTATVVARRAASDATLVATSVADQTQSRTALTTAARSQQVIQSIVDQLPAIDAEVAAAAASLDNMTVQLSASQTAALLASAEVQTRTNQMQILQTELSRNAAVASSLADANAALGRVLQSLPVDPELSAIQESVKVRAVVAGESSSSVNAAIMVAQSELESLSAALLTSQSAASAAAVEVERLAQALANAKSRFASTQMELVAARQVFDAAVNELPAVLSDEFALSQLKPLTPEQLCWSIFKVTAVYDRYLAAEVVDLDKSAPLTAEQLQDPVAVRARSVDLEQRVYDKLKSYIQTYANLYGGAAGQPQTDFYASADQALFTSNGGEINSWTGPTSGNAAERIVTATDPRVAAEELYLGILTRMPTDDEVAEVTSFLARRTDRPKAAQELVWSLLSSAEFRFNR